MSKITAIWAQGELGVIGSNGQIPWTIPQDLAFFKEQTMGGAVIMGRKTWESIPEKFRPLSGRVNIVLTNDMTYEAKGALVVHSTRRAIDVATHNPNVFIIGGDMIYRQFMWYVQHAIVTEVDYTAAGDAYAPTLREGEWELTRETYWAESHPGTMGFKYRHMFYDRRK
jgi:dihydrofolate reductase